MGAATGRGIFWIFVTAASGSEMVLAGASREPWCRASALVVGDDVGEGGLSAVTADDDDDDDDDWGYQYSVLCLLGIMSVVAGASILVLGRLGAFSGALGAGLLVGDDDAKRFFGA